ncbi:MAG: peptide deformylase [Opitutales bacterium]
MNLRVTQYGEPILKEPGSPVTEFGAPLRELANDMLETMAEHEGIGLAAQQLGLALQFFVLDMRVMERAPDFTWTFDGKQVPLDMIMPLAVANPELTLGGEPEPYEEGCLSFPGIRAEVIRPRDSILRYQDLEGASHEIRTNGLFARVIQHEYDHCQGVLFIDRVKPPNLRRLDSRLKKLKRATRDWLRENRSPTA